MLSNVPEVNDQTIQIDHEGYLPEPADWNIAVVRSLMFSNGS